MPTPYPREDPPKRVMVLAGEASGDLHAAHLVEELKGLDPGVEVFGAGGEKMRDAGVELLYNLVEISSVGLVGVLQNYSLYRRIFRSLVRALDARRPGIVLLVDSPGFNLRFAREAKKRGIRVVYYISPQVWAWGASRIPTIASRVDRMMVILPFERDLYAETDLRVDFVGHPLLDVERRPLSRQDFLSRCSVEGGGRVLGLLPGSRRREWRIHLPILLETARMIRNALPDTEVVLARPTAISREETEAILRRHPDVPVRVFEGEPCNVMAHSDLALVASGTATLETALFDTPMIILYKGAFLEYLIAKRVVKIPYIGLVNVVARRKVIPEFLQYEARPERIAEEAVRIFTEPRRVRVMKAAFRRVRRRLGGPGASARSAQIVLSEIRASVQPALLMDEHVTPTRETYLRVLQLLKPYKLILFGAVGSMVGYTVLQGASIMSFWPIIDGVIWRRELTVPPSVHLPAFLHRGLVDLFAFLNTFERYPNLLNIIVVFLVSINLVKYILEYLKDVFMEIMGQRVVRDLRNQVYKHLEHLSLDYFSKGRTGEMVSRITFDIAYIMECVSGRFAKSLLDVIQLPLYAFIMIALNWRLALLSSVIIPVVIIPINVVGKKIRRLAKRAQEKVADITSFLIETISGIRVVKAFNMEDYELKKFKGETQRLYRVMTDTIRKSAFLSPMTEYAGVLLGCLLIYVAARDVIKKSMTPGELAPFIICALAMAKPLKQLGKLNVAFQKSMAAAVRIFHLLDTERTVQEAPTAAALPSLEDRIRFDNVSFSYGNGEAVLKDVSFTVFKGEVIAIVGPSGVGKTSLVNLLPRFYDPTDGGIYIDGHDIRKVTFASLREQMGIVTQETVLFNDTVRSNIAYGRSKETSDEEIVRAAKAAQAHEFIIELPDGYDTLIGEKGVLLSGGQRQRLAIARAILKNPAILILDEATSALDTESERLVQRALDYLMRGRTVFGIAHRLSTIKHANKILVLEGGRIVQSGTHEELIRQEGPYERLYRLQFF